VGKNTRTPRPSAPRARARFSCDWHTPAHRGIVHVGVREVVHELARKDWERHNRREHYLRLHLLEEAS
jgi:PHP family Zn ribbon phosphoesterase